MSSNINCVDLFAGAGGLSLSAIRSGLVVKAAIEIDKNAANTYYDNFCKKYYDIKLYNEDIRTIDPSSVINSAFKLHETCDLILGGPPCQGFSTHRINNSGVNDPRNELLLTYFNFVRSFRPSVFLLENVPGMLWPRHKDYLDRFYKEATISGYKVKQPILIDAADYGIPQRRKRVFILGIRKDINTEIAWPPPATHGSEKEIKNNPALLPWVPCKEVFKENIINDPNNIHMKHSDELVSAFNNTPRNGGSRRDSGRILKCHEQHDGHKDVYGRINPFTVAPTMTTACINPSKGRFVHPVENHGITARQAARIQTFPDDFIFSGGLIASGQQIGNAVPVRLGEILINCLKPLLFVAKEKSLATTLNETDELAC